MGRWRDYTFLIPLFICVAIAALVVLRFSSVLDIIAVLWDAFVPFVIGCFMAFVLNIIVKRYESWMFPKVKAPWAHSLRRSLAIVGALVTILLAFFIVGRMAMPQLIHSVGIIVQAVPTLYVEVLDKVNHWTDTVPMLANTTTYAKLQSLSPSVLSKDVSAWGAAGGMYLVHTMSTAFEFVFNVVIGFIFAIYILLDKEVLEGQCGRFFRAYLSDTWVRRVTHATDVAFKTFSSFFIGQFLDALILGVLVGIGLAIAQVPYALTIACVIGLTALVPLLGAYIGGLMGVLMLLPINPWDALIFIIVLIVMQQIEGNFIYPRIVGGSVGLPSIWVFMAITIGGTLYGIIGILLSVPILATIYKLVREDVQRRLAEKQESPS